jgi:ribonuclease P protein component
MRHLLTRAHFDVVMAQRPVARTAHFVLHQGVNPLAALAQQDHAVGVVLPKRWAKSAVRRNAIRRAVYRLADQRIQAAAGLLPCGAWVVRLHRGFDKAQFNSPTSSVFGVAVEAELHKLLSSVHALDAKASR